MSMLSKLSKFFKVKCRIRMKKYSTAICPPFASHVELFLNLPCPQMDGSYGVFTCPSIFSSNITCKSFSELCSFCLNLSPFNV